jgi:hypothetical protein
MIQIDTLLKTKHTMNVKQQYAVFTVLDLTRGARRSMDMLVFQKSGQSFVYLKI